MTLARPPAPLTALPPACGNCGDAAHLYIDEPDGDAACLTCGWRPSRRPTARERLGLDYLDRPRKSAR